MLINELILNNNVEGIYVLYNTSSGCEGVPLSFKLVVELQSLCQVVVHINLNQHVVFQKDVATHNTTLSDRDPKAFHQPKTTLSDRDPKAFH